MSYNYQVKILKLRRKDWKQFGKNIYYYHINPITDKSIRLNLALMYIACNIFSHTVLNIYMMYKKECAVTKDNSSVINTINKKQRSFVCVIHNCSEWLLLVTRKRQNIYLTVHFTTKRG